MTTTASESATVNLNGNGEAPKRRGRPPGSKNKPKEAAATPKKRGRPSKKAAATRTPRRPRKVTVATATAPANGTKKETSLSNHAILIEDSGLVVISKDGSSYLITADLVVDRRSQRV